MKNFKELILKAQRGDHNEQEVLLGMYKPLLIKESVIDGVYDEDLYQELCYRFLVCVGRFVFNT